MTIHTLTAYHNRLAFLKGTPDALDLLLLDADDKGPAVPLVQNIRCSQPFQRLVWANDGGSIFYAADDGNWFHELWRVDVKTGATEQLTDYFHTNTYPLAAHPDGSTLLAMSNLRGELNVRKLDFSSGDFRKITDYASPVRTAVYAPDGSRIAYTANATHNPHNSDIYVMDADGFDKRKALSTLTGTLDTVHDWSANGVYLAVDSNVDEGRQVGILNIQTLALHWFTPIGETASTYGFSPEGARLLVESPNGLTAVSVPDGQPIPLTPQPVSSATWLDPQRVAFGTTDGDLFMHALPNQTTTQIYG